MENNAIITARLKDVLDVMDARQNISVFLNGDVQELLKSGKVYEILTDSSFMRYYGNREVRALVFNLVNSILIDS